jgi:hypothetical protein
MRGLMEYYEAHVENLIGMFRPAQAAESGLTPDRQAALESVLFLDGNATSENPTT